MIKKTGVGLQRKDFVQDTHKVVNNQKSFLGLISFEEQIHRPLRIARKTPVSS